MLRRRALLEDAGVLVGALSIGVRINETVAAASSFDARAEAKKIAFDRIGHGYKVLLISGFPQTGRSWETLWRFWAATPSLQYMFIESLL
jgi:hypothetical protein